MSSLSHHKRSAVPCSNKHSCLIPFTIIVTNFVCVKSDLGFPGMSMLWKCDHYYYLSESLNSSLITQLNKTSGPVTITAPHTKCPHPGSTQ